MMLYEMQSITLKLKGIGKEELILTATSKYIQGFINILRAIGFQEDRCLQVLKYLPWGPLVEIPKISVCKKMLVLVFFSW